MLLGQLACFLDQLLLCGGSGLAAQGRRVLADPFRELFRIGDQRFHGRGNCDFSGILCAPLRFQVEKGERVDLVAPKFHAHRLGRVRGEEIEDPAAMGELSRTADLIGALIAAPGQRGDHCVLGDRLPLPERQTMFPHLGGRDRILQSGVDAGDHTVAVPGKDAFHRQEPLVLVFMGGPFGIAQAEIARREERGVHPHSGEIVGQALRFRLVRRDHKGPAALPC